MNFPLLPIVIETDGLLKYPSWSLGDFNQCDILRISSEDKDIILNSFQSFSYWKTKFKYVSKMRKKKDLEIFRTFNITAPTPFNQFGDYMGVDDEIYQNLKAYRKQWTFRKNMLADIAYYAHFDNNRYFLTEMLTRLP